MLGCVGKGEVLQLCPATIALEFHCATAGRHTGGRLTVSVVASLVCCVCPSSVLLLLLLSLLLLLLPLLWLLLLLL